MKKIITIIILAVVINGCSSGLYIIPKEFIEYKEYQLNDFDVFVFNICEDYSIMDKKYHFCNCHENFYDEAKIDSIKKVEEVYLLLHKTTNLALYLTTFSHKYIYEDQTGFLNDSSIYKNSIVLDQIESFYVGMYETDTVKHIYFDNKKRKKPDVNLHFEKPITTNDALTISSVNIACAENNYSTYKKIEMKNIFSRNLEFINKPDYKMYFYKNQNEVGNVCKKEVEKLYITNSNRGIALFFDYENCMDRVYKVTSKNIPYQPIFSRIK